jgi:LysR family hydrogen peroxide-inducible transcriptional activator
MRHHLDFRTLEQFVVVARLKNFTRAARELHMSQPALSRAIQRLEEDLGQPLFERQPRRVVLTEPGDLMLARAREILKLVEDTFAELSESGRPARVRLGAIPTIAPYFLPAMLGQFASEHPEIAVMVQEDTTEALIQRCRDGEIDLGIVALPIADSSVRVEALFSEELLLVAPPDHPLAKAPAITLKDLGGYPFVMLNEAHCLSENIATICRRQAVQPLTVERTSQLATVQELVSLEHGVSIIPEMARRLDASDSRVYRSFSGVRPARTVALMWNPERYETRSVRALKARARRHARERADRHGR